MATDLPRSATDAYAAMACGDLSSVELLEAQLARIDATNGELNAVVALDVDRARERCRAADAARANGDSWGPLHGLPITIKDSYETEGLVTTSGAPELADHVPERDADGVALLKRAGAVVFAKTNLPMYAADIQSFNDVYGLTRNPWNPERTVGGSSGGSAAALAAGYTLLELGSDIGGSIRCPAHYCGVAGMKPSWWTISKRGHIPGPPGSLRQGDLSVAGPMARTVADVALAMDVLCSDGIFGIPGTSLPGPSPMVGDLSRCRIGVWLDDPVGPISADMRAALVTLADALSDAGAQVITDLRPASSSERWFALYYEMLTAAMSGRMDADMLAFLAEVAAGGEPGSTDPAIAAARGATITYADWMARDEDRHQLMAEWDDVFAQVDVMLAPPAPGAAFPHDETPIAMRTLTIDGVEIPAIMHLFWAGLATLPLLPAASVPIGLSSEGLPLGVQIVGPRWGDMTTLSVARHVEELTGGFAPPPGYA